MENGGQIGALLGSGRSGSTWLGTILAAHPSVTYRFEPFSRLRHAGDPEIVSVIDRALGLADPPLTLDDLDRVLRTPCPTLVKPPFQPPSVVRSSVRWATWTTARVTKTPALMRRVEPTDRPWLIFKDVDVVRTIPALLKIDVPVLFLTRDPRAVVASRLQGQTNGHMPSGRQSIVGDILSKRSPELFQAFQAQLPDLSPAMIEALLWRVDTDDAFDRLAEDERAAVCFYDELIHDPVTGTEKALAHFGLDLHPQVERFIEATIAGPSRHTRWQYGEIGIKPYFSVFRDPAQSANKWRDQLTAADVAGVESVLEGSVAWTAGRDRGLWN